ncbi:MAG: hypothetical protein GKR87_01540 [Kiritimatiellae bacterium]|nr:hypothetical protein [Kiritimatiellia bacterium]
MKMVYLDKSGVGKRLHRLYARYKRVETVYARVTEQRKERVSIIAAMEGKQFKAPMRFPGYCNTELFNTWLEGRPCSPYFSQGKPSLWTMRVSTSLARPGTS